MIEMQIKHILYAHTVFSTSLYKVLYERRFVAWTIWFEQQGNETEFLKLHRTQSPEQFKSTVTFRY